MAVKLQRQPLIKRFDLRIGLETRAGALVIVDGSRIVGSELGAAEAKVCSATATQLYADHMHAGLVLRRVHDE